MKKEGFYSSGEFAKMARVTLRTLRFYDKKNILKPSFVTEKGSRFYTEEDFARLQQILLLKHLGFSLEEIRNMTISDWDSHFMENSLRIQLKLVRNKIEQMQLVEQAIQDTMESFQRKESVDWSHMIQRMHLTGLEESLRNQYQDASNISARINLHKLYSQNQEDWFAWIWKFLQIQNNQKILEVGCGDGTLWKKREETLPSGVQVILTDISEGMLRDARRRIGGDSKFQFEVADCHKLPYSDNTFDVVIANHVLFYCKDVEGACREISRVLKKGGVLLCSTYGARHMKEISQLVCEFDKEIVLSFDILYERFGKEGGRERLLPFMSQVQWEGYEDCLNVTEAEPLISYVLSCHGNQNQYLMEHYREFRDFVKKRVESGLQISKDAGIFYCKK